MKVLISVFPLWIGFATWLLGMTGSGAGCFAQETSGEAETDPSSADGIRRLKAADRVKYQNIANLSSNELLRLEFEHLEQMAKEMRASKVCFATGIWHLEAFYDGLTELPKAATDKEWTSRIDRLKKWVEMKPNSVTARVALADAWVSYGWKARGGKFANEVREEAWKAFEERLEVAEKCLAETAAFAENCPCRITVLQRIAMGKGWGLKVFDAIMARAAKEAPDFSRPSYMKAQYLLPRWYGEPGDWERHALREAEKVGGGEGDILYSRIVWYIDAFQYENIFSTGTISWEKLRHGFDALLTKDPQNLFVLSEYAHLAFDKGDREVCRRLFDQLQNRMESRVWRKVDNFVAARRFAYGK